MSQPTKGAAKLGAGAGLIGQRKGFGTNPATSVNDVVGPNCIPLKAAFNMGLIDATSGTILTVSRPHTPTGV